MEDRSGAVIFKYALSLLAVAALVLPSVAIASDPDTLSRRGEYAAAIRIIEDSSTRTASSQTLLGHLYLTTGQHRKAGQLAVALAR